MPQASVRTVLVFLFGVVLVTGGAVAAENEKTETGLSPESARALVEKLKPEVEEIRGLVRQTTRAEPMS